MSTFYRSNVLQRPFVALAALLITPFMMSAPALAEYPERAITYILTNKSGGGTDMHNRAYSTFFAKHLGGKFAPVNKPPSSRGLPAIAMAKPDGYTIGNVNLPTMAELQILGKTRFNFDSFAYIGALNVDPTALYVRIDSKYKTLKDLIADARKNPGKINVGSSGPTNHGTLYFRLQDKLGIKLNIVPMGGGGPTRKGVLGGHIAAGVQGMGAVAKYHGKRLRLLAQFSPVRLSHGATVPTSKENGIEMYSHVVRAIAAPAGVPKKILVKLRKAHIAAMNDPAWLAHAKKLKIPVTYLSPAEVDKRARESYKRFSKIFNEVPELKQLIRKSKELKRLRKKKKKKKKTM